jgi:hypothetical protein
MAIPQPGQNAADSGILAAQNGHATGMEATSPIDAHLIRRTHPTPTHAGNQSCGLTRRNARRSVASKNQQLAALRLERWNGCILFGLREQLRGGGTILPRLRA